MRKRRRVPEREDGTQSALRVVEQVAGGALVLPGKRQKNPAAQALSRLGASKGGKARAAKLTPQQRREIARQAARARWSRRP